MKEEKKEIKEEPVKKIEEEKQKEDIKSKSKIVEEVLSSKAAGIPKGMSEPEGSDKEEKKEKEVEEPVEGITKEEIKKIEEKADVKKGKKTFDKEAWKPKTTLGRKVKSGEITKLDYVLDNGFYIREEKIVDVLLPNLESDLLLIGQSKGKFGGGQRRVFKQTQKKTQEGNKPNFAASAIVGNRNGFVGLGYGKAKETVPAREKAIRRAKLNIIKIRRGCGSWQCGCKEPHTIPFEVKGKCGSVIIRLMPAPKGTGLCINGECAKLLRLAGIKDIWSKTIGQTKTRTNAVVACFKAMKKLMKTRVNQDEMKKIGVVEGEIENGEKA